MVEILRILFFRGNIRTHKISIFIEKNIHAKEGVPIYWHCPDLLNITVIIIELIRVKNPRKL